MVSALECKKVRYFLGNIIQKRLLWRRKGFNQKGNDIHAVQSFSTSQKGLQTVLYFRLWKKDNFREDFFHNYGFFEFLHSLVKNHMLLGTFSGIFISNHQQSWRKLATFLDNITYLKNHCYQKIIEVLLIDLLYVWAKLKRNNFHFYIENWPWKLELC